MAKKRNDDEKISKHFQREEFRCRDDNSGPCPYCGGSVGTRSAEAILAVADKIRDALGKPVVCTSGYRCEQRNAEVGGVPHSYHTQGMAMDIYSTGTSLNDLAKIAKAAGAGGIGKYVSKKFVHIDTGGMRTWTE